MVPVAVFAALFIGFSLWLATPCTKSALAISGCCMTKNDSGDWKKTDKSLETCEEENKDKDDDDYLFEALGTVWWNLECQKS